MEKIKENAIQKRNEIKQRGRERSFKERKRKEEIGRKEDIDVRPGVMKGERKSVELDERHKNTRKKKRDKSGTKRERAAGEDLQ